MCKEKTISSADLDFEIEKAIDKRLNVFDLKIEKQKLLYYTLHGVISFFVLFLSSILLIQLFTYGNMTDKQFSLAFIFSIIGSVLIYHRLNEDDLCGFKYNLLKEEETQKIIQYCNEQEFIVNPECAKWSDLKDYEPFKYKDSLGLLSGKEIEYNDAYKVRFDIIGKQESKITGARLAFNSRSGRSPMRLPAAFENYIKELKMQKMSIVVKKEKKKIAKYLERKTQYYSYISKYLKSPDIEADLNFLKYAYQKGDSFARKQIEETMSEKGKITYAQLDELLPIYLLEKQILNLADEYVEANYDIMKKYISLSV